MGFTRMGTPAHYLASVRLNGIDVVSPPTKKENETMSTERFNELTSGITYTAQFVPLSQSRNAGRWESINWHITLKKGSLSLETDYAEGIAHIPQHMQKRIGRLDKRNPIVAYLLETGQLKQGDCPAIKSYPPNWDIHQHTSEENSAARLRKLQPPKLVDVIHCLVCDSDVLDYSSFEDWVMDYGFDTDSRKAEQTYRQCLDIALKLRCMVGETSLQELQELF
jgi:hypothetical protein